VAEPSRPGKTPSTNDLAEIRRRWRPCAGKIQSGRARVRHLRKRTSRARGPRRGKGIPGRKLADFEELLAWLDVLPAGDRPEGLAEDFMVEQVAGLYDSEAKEMCIPAFSAEKKGAEKTKSGTKPAEEKGRRTGGDRRRDCVRARIHSCVGDQYWPIDHPEEQDRQESTDRDTARSFLYEGSATRLMIEALPAVMGGKSPAAYRFAWNLIHSAVGEAALDYALGRVWKGSEVKTPGVPEALARMEAMPYSFGYSFCTGIMRQWGLDGLDHIYDHPPVSTEQMMHPEKCWSGAISQCRSACRRRCPAAGSEEEARALARRGWRFSSGVRRRI